MKKIFLTAIYALSLSVCFYACSDDDEQSSSDDEQETGLLSLDTLYRDKVVCQLCDVDTLSMGSVTYTPTKGEVLDESTPTIYSIGVDSEAEATSFFYSNCVPVGEEDNVTKGSDGSLTYSFGTCGTVKYTPVNSKSMIGYIDVNISDLDCLTKIEIIPSSLWPNNAYSAFYVGDVVQDNGGRWWICVRANEGGQQGILMTWDTSGRDLTQKERSDADKSYINIKGCADKEAWDALAQFYYDDPNNFKAELKALRALKGCTNGIRNRALEDIASGLSITHQVGNTRDNKYWYGIFWMLWECWNDYVNVNPKNISTKTGLPKFESGTMYFKRKGPVEVPQYRDSKAIRFSSYDGISWETNYKKVYPIN